MDFLHLAEAEPGLWEQFQEERPLDTEDPVVARWLRSRSAGSPPLGLCEEAVLEAERLAERQSRHAELLIAAQPVFDEAIATFSAAHYRLLLTDADGIVLRRGGGGEFEATADRARLIEGAVWSEPVRGTNAIGTAIVESRPIVVQGRAHFDRLNHGLVCYAAPILRRGEVVAVVDATSFSGAANPLVGLAVRSSARLIEDRLSELTRRDGATEALHLLLERISDPAIVYDPRLRVRLANGPGRALLQAGRLDGVLPGLLGARGHRVEVVLPELGVARLRAEALGDDWLVLVESARRARPSDPPQARAAIGSRLPERAGEVAPVHPAFATLQGSDARLIEAKSRGSRFARTTLPVLLLAETGTGKELLARAVHAASPRRDRPFVALNCGALSAQLLETELFGYADGAFTGARAGGRPGKLELASGGTLFLDEIAEMPMALQAMVLRVLEDGAFYRVGDDEPRRTELRLVCATCQDLESMVRDGRFRSDLFHRIRGASLTLPPLRVRTDRLELAEALLARLAEAEGRASKPRLSSCAVAWILSYSWPGNVRELKTALTHALVLADGELRREHFPAASPGAEVAGVGGFEAAESNGSSSRTAPARTHSRAGAERAALTEALAESDGNLSEAARLLGVARSTLYRMMERHGLG